MVLQRAPQKAVVWGFGDTSKLTTLHLDSKTHATMSASEPTNEQEENIWLITLDPALDEGPCGIHVSQPLATGTLFTMILHNVLFGDVWLCSGQSNMPLTVGMIYNATNEVENADNFPKRRVFTASLKLSVDPVEGLLGIRLNWSVASSQSTGGSD